MKTVTLNIGGKDALALKQMLDIQFDINSDMVMDEAFYRVEDIRKLAVKSDEEIKTELTRRNKAMDSAIDRLVAIAQMRMEINNQLAE